jgi:hypothetical protein
MTTSLPEESGSRHGNLQHLEHPENLKHLENLEHLENLGD